MPRPVDAFGDPEAVFCRWCEAGRTRLRGAMFCETCDAPPLGLLRPTWKEPRP